MFKNSNARGVDFRIDWDDQLPEIFQTKQRNGFQNFKALTT